MTRLEERFSAVEKQLAGLDKQLSAQNERFAAADKRLDRYDERFLVGEKQLVGPNESQVAIEKRLAGCNEQLATIKKPPVGPKGPRVAVKKPPVEPAAYKEAVIPPGLEFPTVQQILNKEPSLTTALCSWQKVTRRFNATDSEIFTDLYEPCVRALVKAGLIKTKQCFNQVGSACQRRSITPLNGTRVDERGITFACGTIEVGKIVSIVPLTNTARVTYERTLTLNTELTNKLKACPLEIPQQDTASASCNFEKTPAGDWVYSP